MNSRDREVAYRDGIALLDRRFQWRDGDVKVNVTNDDEHEVAKFLVFLEMKRLGKRVITEAIFSNGKRADIYIPEDREVVEIAHSEGKKSLDAKVKHYAVDGVGVRVFQATEIVNAWLRKR